MISLPSRLPMLRIGAFQLMRYERSWLEQTIRNAAKRAGHDEWWFANDVARSVMLYLEDRFPENSITIEELTFKIRRVLGRIGFSDVAEAVELAPPAMEVSLHALALEAEGSELGFFALLDSRLEELRGLGVREISLTQSRRSFKHLRAARHWCDRCRQLEEELLSFIRHRTAADLAVKVQAA
jgi:hypothetical protein